MRRQGWWDALWFVAFAAASSAWCVGAAARLGPTFDEPTYLERGLKAWHTGSHTGLLELGTMPLPTDVQTFPLFVWELSQGRIIDPKQDLCDVLFWMRLGNLVFWWLLLWYARLTGRSLAGPWGGRLAVALVACEPSLLANASLATTDLAVTACLLVFLYHFRAGRELGGGQRVALPAVLFGLAIAAKASAIVYGPICMAVVEMERLVRSGALARQAGTTFGQALAECWRRLQPSRRDFIWIGLGGLACTFVFCGSNFEVHPSFVKWAHKLPEGDIGAGMVWVSEHLCIFSNAGEGIVRQVRHNLHGHGTYLLGRDDENALWYYFPVLLTIKLTLPILLLPFAVVAARPKALLNWAFLCALTLLLFSPLFRVQIGIRMVLLLIVLALVGSAAGLVTGVQTAPRKWTRSALAGVAAAVVLWALAIAGLAWPNGLSYVNEIWGGPERGYKVVSDANYDWGQGLPELLAWQRTHGEEVDLWYWGRDPRWEQSPFRKVPLHALVIKSPGDVVAHLRNRYFAAATTMLYGNAIDFGGHRAAASFLRDCRPVAKTSTFLIYRREDLEEACLRCQVCETNLQENIPR